LINIWINLKMKTCNSVEVLPRPNSAIYGNFDNG
jgi:hypothetical protein